MKKFTFPMLLATALVAASCSNEDLDSLFDDSNLSRIELGDAGNTTRTGFHDAETTLKIHYVSAKKAYDESTFPYNDGPAEGLNMTSTATAAVDGEADFSAVTQTTGSSGQQRYWDDIHGKNSLLTLYAIAVPNQTTITNTANSTAFGNWDTNQKKGTTSSVSHEIAWSVSTTQTTTTIADEDLAYSNNISGGNTLGFNHGTKKFDIATGDKALQFNHALSRFTINVKKGTGFDDGYETNFKVTSVKLSSFGTSGSLNVTAGTMSNTANVDVEVKETQAVLNNTEPSPAQIGYTYSAQVLPNANLRANDNTMLTIVVDGNNYYIKGSEIYAALPGEDNETKQTNYGSVKSGNNYNLNITINKTGIAISQAKLVAWETISGTEMTPSNAVSLTTTMEGDAGVATTVASDLYRSTSLTTGYNENKTTLATNNTMGATWYWPDNTTAYYFRTIAPQNTTVSTNTTPDPDVDYITMTGGAIAVGNDYIWGAPLKEIHEEGADSHPIDYNVENGFNNYLYDAIGATESQIKITQHHMMSKIEVNLTTSETDDQVDLSEATVEIQQFYNTATLALSNALITTTGAKVETQAMTADSDYKKHTWRVIPQETSGIILKITAEGNVYNVPLPASTGIDRWLPGKSYQYTFNLLKTGIKISQAKLVDWITVTGTNQDITLEK